MALEFELEIAEGLARKAGQMVISLQQQGTTRYKADNEGPVTDGDLVSCQIIAAGLKKHFPLDPIISEESFEANHVVPSTGRLWLIDPIDGTKDYAAGGLEYAVMIGLAIDGRPQLGVIFEPATQTLWRAKPGCAERVEASGHIAPLKIHDKTFSQNEIGRAHV